MLNRVPTVHALVASLLALAILGTALLPVTAQEATPAADVAVDPLAIGTPGRVGDYEITVLSVIPDAASTILDHNQFNTEPAPGTLFFLARLQVTYVGETSGTPWLELSFNAVGRDPEAPYSEFEHSCGEIPESGSSVSTELFTGGTIEYNVCWAIDQADVGILTLNVSSFSGNGDQEVRFAIGDPSLAPPAAATPEATPEALPSARFEPIPVGTASLVSGYTVEVVSVESNATDLILASDTSGNPPAEGNQFFMVTISITNQGEQTSSPYYDLNFKAVGERSVGYNEFTNTCGTIPASGEDVRDLAPGDAVEFNVCWEIQSTEAESLVMYVDPTYASDKEGRTWFSIQP